MFNNIIPVSIALQACTQNYKCLASQAKKLEKQLIVRCLKPTVHPMHTLIFKNNLQKCLWNLNLSLHTNYNSLTSQTKKLEKQLTVHYLQPTVHPVHTLILKNN